MPFTKSRKSDDYLGIIVVLGSGQLLTARKHLKARINIWTSIFQNMTKVYDSSLWFLQVLMLKILTWNHNNY